VALLGLFILLERRRAQPLVALRLFRRRSFLVGTASCLLAYAALFTVTASMPFYLVEVQGRSLIDAGLLVGVVPVALGLTAPFTGWIADRAGARWVCTAGLFAVSAGLLLAALTPAHAATAWTTLALALVGAGLGAYESPNSAASLSALPDQDLGIGAATFGVLRNLGMTIGAAVAGNLLGMRRSVGELGEGGGEGGAGTVAVADIHQVLALGALCAAAGMVIVALRPGGHLAGPSVDRREQQR
jgi:DHA2 family multidrug resistance protein-like MFS transporter